MVEVGSGNVTVRELELKFEVPAAFRVPDLVAEVGCVAGVRERPRLRLSAVYYDTEDLRLARWGVTLRRREGGADAGWHLKLPVGEGTRDEVRLPLSAGAEGEVPLPLIDLVTVLHRGATLTAVATLRTLRRPLLLLDGDGRPFAELVDDDVTILQGSEVSGGFRELEVEAVATGDEERVRAVAACLTRHGGRPGGAPKVVRALGPRASAAPDVPEPVGCSPHDPAGQALRDHLATHARRFLHQDIRVRRDLPDSVHQMRVAARHLRSGLKVFSPLVEESWARQLRAELGWAAAELGEVRDTEVLVWRLRDHAASLPPRQAGLATCAVEDALQACLADARVRVIASLRSQRYLRLVEALVVAANDPPLTDRAAEPCDEVLPHLISQSWQRLSKKVDQLHRDGPAVEWHQARIAAKKTRYAVDAAAPIFGGHVTAFAHAMAQITDILGEQHDAQVAQQALEGLVERARADGPTGYSLGLLAGNERAEELRLRDVFDSGWAAVEKAHHRARRLTS